MPATRPVTDAVIPASTIVQHNNSNIGYLAYNSFDTESDTQLLEFSKTCATNNVKDFVLDLRYNAGGDMEAYKDWPVSLPHPTNWAVRWPHCNTTKRKAERTMT